VVNRRDASAAMRSASASSRGGSSAWACCSAASRALRLLQGLVQRAQGLAGIAQALRVLVGQLPGQQALQAAHAVGQRITFVAGIQRRQVLLHARQALQLRQLRGGGQRRAVVGGFGLLQLLRQRIARTLLCGQALGIVLGGTQRGRQALFEAAAAQRQHVVEGRQRRGPTLQFSR
jgi:hypothetical protein